MGAGSVRIWPGRSCGRTVATSAWLDPVEGRHSGSSCPGALWEEGETNEHPPPRILNLPAAAPFIEAANAGQNIYVSVSLTLSQTVAPAAAAQALSVAGDGVRSGPGCPDTDRIWSTAASPHVSQAVDRQITLEQ